MIPPSRMKPSPWCQVISNPAGTQVIPLTASSSSVSCLAGRLRSLFRWFFRCWSNNWDWDWDNYYLADTNCICYCSVWELDSTARCCAQWRWGCLRSARSWWTKSKPSFSPRSNGWLAQSGKCFCCLMLKLPNGHDSQMLSTHLKRLHLYKILQQQQSEYQHFCSLST